MNWTWCEGSGLLFPCRVQVEVVMTLTKLLLALKSALHHQAQPPWSEYKRCLGREGSTFWMHGCLPVDSVSNCDDFRCHLVVCLSVFLPPGLLPSSVPSQNVWRGNLFSVFKKICAPVSRAVDSFPGNSWGPGEFTEQLEGLQHLGIRLCQH